MACKPLPIYIDFVPNVQKCFVASAGHVCHIRNNVRELYSSCMYVLISSYMIERFRQTTPTIWRGEGTIEPLTRVSPLSVSSFLPLVHTIDRYYIQTIVVNGN